MTLHPEKFKFARNQVPVLGDRIHEDPEKVTAITDMAVQSKVSELCQFLGVVNQLSKFSPKLAEKRKQLSTKK